MNSVTVIVACRNEIRRLEAFLRTLVGQDWGGLEWEVILADGRSTDGTREVLERWAREHPGVRIIDNPDRIIPTGLNAAIRAARGEIILRMDAHTEYAPDYVRSCVETLEATGADNVGGPPRVRPDSLRMRVLGAAFHSPFAVGGSRSHDPDYDGYVDTVSFGCWRKTTLERLGLFDERLVRNQDDELNLRLTRSGGRVWQSPRIVSWYHPRATLWALFRQYFLYGMWKVAVIRKHRLLASWRHVAPGSFVAVNVALAVWWPAAWAALLLLYSTACAAAAVAAARRHGWQVLPFLPAVFATYHLGYGLGFLTGLVRFGYWR